MNRKLLGAAMLVAIVFGPAQPAFAHGGNGGSSSDYRIEVTGFQGDASGINMQPVELGNRMELIRTTAKEVQIPGYDGEPYIRLDADGVFVNLNSPAYYVNLDRFARKPIPVTATDSATPNWLKISSGTSVRWHDHRTHWMDTTPRADVRADPGVERLISSNPVNLIVDGRKVAAIVTVTWLPPPSRIAWLVVSSLAACALLAAMVLVPAVRQYEMAFALAGAVLCLVGSGTSKFRVTASAVAIVAVIVGWLLKKRWLPVGAALLIVVLAVTHFEVFEHELLAGWAPELLQRVAITMALAFAAAVVGYELVVGLGASSTVEHETETEETPLVEPAVAEP